MVQKINWDDSLLLNVPEIDAQHKQLLQIANKLYDIATGTPEVYTAKMPEIIKELTDYTKYHFSFEEENYMHKYGYTNLPFHKMQHANFVQEIKLQSEKLRNADQHDGLQLYEYLAKWVVNHIAKSDPAWAYIVRPKLNENK